MCVFFYLNKKIEQKEQQKKVEKISGDEKSEILCKIDMYMYIKYIFDGNNFFENRFKNKLTTTRWQIVHVGLFGASVFAFLNYGPTVSNAIEKSMPTEAEM